MSITVEKVLLLKQFSFLKNVSNMALSDLIAVAEECSMSVGDVLIAAGKNNRAVYFILSGRLECLRQDEKKEITAKKMVGLTSVFSDDPADETIQVVQEGIALKVSWDKLYRTMSLHPSLAMAILNELSILARK